MARSVSKASAGWRSQCDSSSVRKSRDSQPQALVATGQRGWKAQPSGGLAASGISPRGRSRAMLRSGSGSGIARSSAWVYGCFGSRKISSVSPTSTIRPRYMMATRSQKNFALARSWVM